jgi:hypothetical protein
MQHLRGVAQVQVSVSRVSSEPEDPRRVVTLREPGTPWPIRFAFLIVRDQAGEPADYVNFSFALGDDETARAIDATTLQRIAASYGAYLEIARGAFVLDLEGLRGAIGRLRGPGRKPARLGDDFYRLIAADYESRKAAGGHPVGEMAKEHFADRTTVWRWVKEARARGYIAD